MTELWKRVKPLLSFKRLLPKNYPVNSFVGCQPDILTPEPFFSHQTILLVVTILVFHRHIFKIKEVDFPLESVFSFLQRFTKSSCSLLKHPIVCVIHTHCMHPQCNILILFQHLSSVWYVFADKRNHFILSPLC